MNKIYLTLLLACSFVLSGQELANNELSRSTESHDFTLHPNPAFGDVVYVTTKKNDHKEITVYDVFGKVVLRDRIATNSLNISRLVPGVYVLQVIENNNSMTRKLVVK